MVVLTDVLPTIRSRRTGVGIISQMRLDRTRRPSPFVVDLFPVGRDACSRSSRRNRIQCSERSWWVELTVFDVVPTLIYPRRVRQRAGRGYGSRFRQLAPPSDAWTAF
jgi:hypothetical protein